MNYFIDCYSYLMVNRIGVTDDAFMKTTNVTNEIIPGYHYKVYINGLKCLGELEESEKPIKKEIKIEIPKYVEIEGKWKNTEKEQINIGNDDANILGGFGKFEINQDILNVPGQEANENNLAYYNVKLLKIDEIIEFESEDVIPLCVVNVGQNYVPNYILQEKYGGGVYFEFHKNPHFHMPMYLESEGYLMLAKQINNKYHISAFKIPFGYATYIPPYVLHNDCFLIGEYYVVYSISKPFSTCLLRNENNMIIDVKIELK
jgi:hypothetical protein